MDCTTKQRLETSINKAIASISKKTVLKCIRFAFCNM